MIRYLIPFVLLSCFIGACSNSPTQYTDVPFRLKSPMNTDTSGASDASDTLAIQAIDYNTYFESKSHMGKPLKLVAFGKLALPSGKIVASDPFFLWDRKPFNKMVEPGTYDVIACAVNFPEGGERYAAVKIEFKKNRAIRWELAVTDDSIFKTLKKDEFYGYSVDCGLGCFVDVKSQEAFNIFCDEFSMRSPNKNIYIHFLAPEFKKNAVYKSDPYDLGSWLNLPIPHQPDLNIIMFNAGWGDGVYPCYWGMDEKGEVCSLLVDFMVF